MKRFPILSLALLPVSLGAVVLATPCSARAQDAGPAEGTDAAESAALTELAEPMVWRGKYFDAAKQLREALELDPTNVRAGWLLGHALRDQGKYESALETLARFPRSPGSLALAVDILLDLGRVDEAAGLCDAALALESAYVPALERQGRIAEARGDRTAAVDHYRAANSAWARSEGEDSYETLLSVGRARLGLFRLSEEFRVSLKSALERFHEAKQKDDRRPHALVEAGRMFLRNYQDVDAKAYFQDALELNPNYAPAIDGKAQQLLFRWDDQQAAEEWKSALRENERYIPALIALAEMALGDGDLDEAQSRFEAAEKVNPAHPEVRAIRAALKYMRNDMDGFEKEVAAAGGLPPGAKREPPPERPEGASPAPAPKAAPDAAVLFRLLAASLEEQRRFAEALAVAERAITADPKDWDAYFLAGRNAANVGDDAKADRYLQLAEDGDIFHNAHRKNFLTVFDKMRKFPEHRDSTFVVKLPPAEEEAYLPLLLPTLHWSIDLLEKKWDFQAEQPLFISVFDSQNDFAVRTIGLPGFPALGACFGRVVTLDSPRVSPPGPFGWRATLHHELAHVITLQLSKGRVPRWLTEGLSVYEERKISPVWNREMERELIDAIASDEVLTLEKINNAFRGARVLFAYYQGGLMCELIERDWGFDKLREMVRLYGDNLGTPDVVRRALGVEPEEFDRRFLAYAKDYVKDIHILPRVFESKMRTLRRHVRKEKDDAQAWFVLACGYIARDKSADALSAVQNLRRIAPDDPRAAAIQAMVAWSKKRPDRAVEMAEAAIAGGFDLFELRMNLAAHYADERVGDYEKAKAHYRKAIELFPQEPSGAARRRLADLLMGEGDEALDDAMKLLYDHTRVSEDDVPTRMRLIAYHRTAGRVDDELALLLEVRDVLPLPLRSSAPFGWSRAQAVELNERIGGLLTGKEDHAGAELAFRMACEIAVMNNGSDDDRPLEDGLRSELHVRHAESLRNLGRVDEARRAAKEALDLDASNDEAQELLERLAE